MSMIMPLIAVIIKKCTEYILLYELYFVGAYLIATYETMVNIRETRDTTSRTKPTTTAALKSTCLIESGW